MRVILPLFICFGKNSPISLLKKKKVEIPTENIFAKNIVGILVTDPSLQSICQNYFASGCI